jgi:hypothetical protein
MSESKLGTIIDGIASSEHVDSSGEILSIEGMDTSSLGSADSILNFEHNSKDNPSQICGKVTFAKKIFKASDCSNEREKHFWEFCQKPFVYIKGELFDHPDLDHDGARNIAALLRYDNRDKGKKARRLISFSVEGGKIEKKGMLVTKSIARDIALTVKHCNKMCIVEILDDIKDRKDLYKKENFDHEPMIKNEFRKLILNDIKKSEWKPTQKQIKEIKLPEKVIEISKTWQTDNNMRKTLIAGIANSAPDAKVGMAALASEELIKKPKKMTKNEENSHAFTLPHSMFSVENAHHPTQFSATHEKMLNKLKEKGFDVEHLNGKYGNEENSILVKNPSERQKSVLNHLARKLGQDSIIHSDGKNHEMLYLNGEKAGQYVKGSGIVIHEQKPDDFYSTTSSGIHFSHNFDFDKLHKNELTDILQKMSRPLMINKELGLGQDPRMDVKYVDPEKEYKVKTTPGRGRKKIFNEPEIENKKLQSAVSAEAKQQISPNKKMSPKKKEEMKISQGAFKNIVNPKGTNALNVSDPEYKINRSYVFKKPDSPKNELDASIHEATHGFFSDIASKYGKEHSKQLSSHMLNNFFHPNDIAKVKSFIKDRGYEEDSPHFGEEHISHISDIINRPSVRKDFLEHASHKKNLKPNASPEDVAQAEELDRRMHKRLNRGWGNSVNFIKDTNGLQNFLSTIKTKK